MGLTKLADAATDAQFDSRPPLVFDEVDSQTFTGAVSEMSTHGNETASGSNGAEGGRQSQYTSGLPPSQEIIVLKGVGVGSWCEKKNRMDELIVTNSFGN